MDLVDCCRRLGLGEADEGLVKSTLAQFEEKLKSYERILAKQKFVAGDVSTPSSGSVLLLFEKINAHLPYS